MRSTIAAAAALLAALTTSGDAARANCLRDLGFPLQSEEAIVARTGTALGRIHVPGDGPSGTAIVFTYGGGVALTASHAVEGAEEEGGRKFVQVEFPGFENRHVRAEIVHQVESLNEADEGARDRLRDVALLYLDGREVARHGLDLVPRMPANFSLHHIFGFPGQNAFPLTDSATARQQGSCTFTFDAHTTKGDSGGPAVNGHGHVAGVVIQSEVRGRLGRFVPMACVAEMLVDELVAEPPRDASGDNVYSAAKLAGRMLEALRRTTPPSVPIEFRPAEARDGWFSNLELMVLIESMERSPGDYLAFEPYMDCPIEQAVFDRLDLRRLHQLGLVRDRMESIATEAEPTPYAQPQEPNQGMTPELTAGDDFPPPDNDGGTRFDPPFAVVPLGDGRKDGPSAGGGPLQQPGVDREAGAAEAHHGGFSSPSAQAAYARRTAHLMDRSERDIATGERYAILTHIAGHYDDAVNGLRGVYTRSEVSGQGDRRTAALELFDALEGLASARLDLAKLDAAAGERDRAAGHLEGVVAAAAEMAELSLAVELDKATPLIDEIQAMVAEVQDDLASPASASESGWIMSLGPSLSPELTAQLEATEEEQLRRWITAGYATSRYISHDWRGGYTSASEFLGKNVVAANGGLIGEIHDVAVTTMGAMAVVSAVGSSSADGAEILLPLQQLRRQGDVVVVQGFVAEGLGGDVMGWPEFPSAGPGMTLHPSLSGEMFE